MVNILSNNINRKFLVIFGLFLTIIFTPISSIYADYNYTSGEGIVPKCGQVTKTIGSDGVEKKEIKTPCDFKYLMDLIRNVIGFLLFYIATPLAALALCYAGWLMLFTGGSEENVTKSKHIIKNVVIWYMVALAAWLIVKTIFITLGFKGENTFYEQVDKK